ncbi:MAG: glycosyltransferase [Chloroflexi bacterium]|nr:glycosyltransferase [Chloroflexota bacterium]
MSRVAMFVFNDCTRDSRVLREAGTLAAAGHDVTIYALPRDPQSTEVEVEERDGFRIERVPPPRGWRRPWAWFWHPYRTWGWVLRWSAFRIRRGAVTPPKGWLQIPVILVGLVLWAPWAVIRTAGHVIGRKVLRHSGPGSVDFLARWRFVIEGWGRVVADRAAGADVFHGHDLTAMPAASTSRRRRGGRLVYDSHEIILESGSYAKRPGWLRGLLRRREQGYVAEADAMVTVNDALAEELASRYAPHRVVVVHNTPARWEPPADRPTLLRDAAGIPAGAPIALYHGGFSAHRGIEELAAAILEPAASDVHAVALGYGSLRATLGEMSADPRYDGRFHVIDAVPPDELPAWVASADVGVMPIQASTLNHRLSTPNKLFECLAAGTPVVVSDFPDMRRIVLEDPDGPLGTTCDPTSPASVAAAIHAVLDLEAAAAADLRARCLRAAHARWNWEAESARLVALYGDLTAPEGGA